MRAAERELMGKPFRVGEGDRLMMIDSNEKKDVAWLVSREKVIGLLAHKDNGIRARIMSGCVFVTRCAYPQTAARKYKVINCCVRGNFQISFFKSIFLHVRICRTFRLQRYTTCMCATANDTSHGKTCMRGLCLRVLQLEDGV